MGANRLMAVATWTEVVEASLRDGTNLPHKLGKECGKALQDNIAYMMGLRDEDQAEIERLHKEVERLKEDAECDAKLKDDLYAQITTTHNDAIEAAADTILTSLADIHMEDGTIDAFNHAVSKCRESIRALKR